MPWKMCLRIYVIVIPKAGYEAESGARCFKDTSYVWGKKQQNLQLLYIVASNSAKMAY